MEPESSLPHSQVPVTCPYPEPDQTISRDTRLSCECFITWYVFKVRSCKHIVQSPKLEDHPLSAVGDSLFNIFAATHHIGGRSSTRILRTRHTVVTRTHLSFRSCCNFADTLRAESGRNCCSVLILLASCQQTCMTYTIAVCTVKNSWRWQEELSETRRILI